MTRSDPLLSHRLLLTLSSLLLMLGGRTTVSCAVSDQPNVVIILADDLGYADLGCYGNRFNESPHLDRLASQGMRFTHFYAGPVCSPTRANLQSGQDQARFAITQHIPGHRRPYARLIDPVVAAHLPLEVETFAERLAAAGYATGYFGKWHLGGAGYGPEAQGWQTVLQCQGHTQPPAVTLSPRVRRTAEFLTERAIEFVDANRDRPFLLQVSHFAVHIPLSTTPKLLAKYEAKPAVAGYPSLPEYAGLVDELDQSVGAITDTIDRLGLSERTLIFFVSDNGGLVHDQAGNVYTSNAPLRGEKGTLHEGGIRVPAIARWPGRIPAGSTCDTPATTTDLHPTFVELASATPAEQQPHDGVSLGALLSDPSAALARDTLYWHLPHYHHSTPTGAIRRGNWKLIEFFEDDSIELYQLDRDIGETLNVASENPAVADQMRSALATWRNQVGAQMPTLNPNFDPQRASVLAKPSRDNRDRPPRVR